MPEVPRGWGPGSGLPHPVLRPSWSLSAQVSVQAGLTRRLRGSLRTWAGVFGTPRGGRGRGRTGGRRGPRIPQTHTCARLPGRKIAPGVLVGARGPPSGADPVPAGAWAAPTSPTSGWWIDLVSVSDVWVNLTHRGVWSLNQCFAHGSHSSGPRRGCIVSVCCSQ